MNMNEMDRRQVLAFLRSHQLMALSTVSPIGAPERSVMYMYVDEDSVEVAEIIGRASVVSDNEEVTRVTEELHKIVAERKSEFWLPPVDQIDGETYVLIKVVPTMVKYVDYADAAKGIVVVEPKYITFNFATGE